MAYTKTQVDDMMDRQLNPFRQDVTGDNVITIVQSTEALYIVDGDARNVATGPAYFTDRWSTANSKMAAISEYDGPTYVADIGFTWTPAAQSSGAFKLKVYIDNSGTRNFAADPLIRTYSGAYTKTAQVNILATWYWGEEAGYDAKNDGVYFTVEFEDHAGSITNPSIVIYNTQ